MYPKTLMTSTAIIPVGEVDLPVDPALPGYASLCHTSQLKATLSPALAQWLGPDAHLLEVRTYLRRLFPGKRCTVQLELTIGRKDGVVEHRRLLGKLYRDDPTTSVYSTLMELSRHGLGAGRFLVPQPVARVPEYHLLLLTWAEGELLSSLFLTHPNATQEVTGAAEWLLTLHNCGLRIGRRYSFPAHLQTLAKWKELLTEVYPEGERLLSALLARCEERGRELSGWVSGPTHRDFTPEHLVVLGNQFTCLDFDEFCQYDPLFDVAHFTAHLRFLGLTHFGALNSFDSLANRFQAAYQAGTERYSEERLNLFKAISYFKLGRFVALVQRPERWQEMLSELLNEARRFL
jgi:hypothetical protein